MKSDKKSDKKTSKIIGIISAALALYWAKQRDEIQSELENERASHKEYVDELVKENKDLQNRLNPNSGVKQSPVVFTVTMISGGVTLNQNEIILNCTNTSDAMVEIGDFRANMWLAGFKSYKVIPSNLYGIKIPAHSTVSFRLYARDTIAVQNYVEAKRALNVLYDGKDQSFMRADTYIPMEQLPVLLNMQYLWYWSGGFEECFAYDIPGSFRWKSAGWTVGTKTGYNAAKEKQQDKNPSYWEKYDTQPIDE